MCTEEGDGVGGPDEVGDKGSVTQRLKQQLAHLAFAFQVGGNYRCDRVATIFATV